MEYPPTSRDSSLSERLYRLLLLAYPRTFRKEYATEMLLAFRDAYRDTSRQQGTLGVLSLWCDFFYDYIKTVCIEHVRSWMQTWQRRLRTRQKGSIGYDSTIQSGCCPGY